jgi:hypothetical protein
VADRSRRPIVRWLIGLVVAGGFVFVGWWQVWPLIGFDGPGQQAPDPVEICADADFGGFPLSGSDLAYDLVVHPGESIQEAAQAAGPGAVIAIGGGRHEAQSVRPLAGQTFVGLDGAVMDGAGAEYAFRSGAPNVSIRGLVIEGYLPDDRQGVIHADEGALDWQIEGNEVHHNEEIGLYVRRGARVVGNSIHHNGRYGISGRGAGLVIDDNTISCNALTHGPSDDAGATKFVFTVGLLLERNLVEANFGNGLWVDINNQDAVIRQNQLVDNLLSGVFIEISCGGLVENNVLSGNGYGSRFPRGVENSAIYVANSPGVTVRSNQLVDNAKGIGGIHWPHPNLDAVDRCEPELRDLVVTDNRIEQAGGIAIGLDAKIDGDRPWTVWGNSFFENEFEVGPGTAFRWRGRPLDQDAWLAETSAQAGS